MNFITVNDVRLHYRLDGASGLPVLLLSNSLGTDMFMWDLQIPQLAQQFQVLRYDTRGHGASETPPGPYTIDQLGQDALGLLNGLGIERASFCGISLGGMTGMWLATQAPERLDRIALCNTAALIGPPDIWNTRIETVRRDGMQAIADGLLTRWFRPPYIERAPREMMQLKQTLAETSPEGYVAACAAVRDMDLRDTVRRIQLPTLVIAGSGDKVTPLRDSQYLIEHIPGARYIELEAAHLSNIEAAEPFTAELLKFMTARDGE
ncbi:MAG: 3-oxoadipate enol-lactonase [Paenibacillus sp.]|nr:3-oxoadipate enol-lactonase [Paenibacillus sp.]